MMVERGRLTLCTAILSVCGAMLFHGTDPAGAAGPSLCLTPVAEQALKELLAAGTFQAALGRDLTLKGLNLNGDQIELRAADTGGREWGISLTLAGSSSRRPDGHGKRFVFHLLPSADARSVDTEKSLLAAADLIDRSIPDTAFADCSGRPSAPEVAQSPVRDYYPRSLALFSAAVQILILLGATVFGWRTIRSTRSA